jgi:hypothetical protein
VCIAAASISQSKSVCKPSDAFSRQDPAESFETVSLRCKEQGDTIDPFRRDAASGRLRATGKVIHNATAVPIAFFRK